ncbi:hypothetical protein L1987_21239 [Smallanthus sonchifolius]|uniref:Uncharacterized protein n=1 Tax=Smallanthus sonchifolius TaxID=185202 RepID=A0ACB9IU31_9ASTR|nr:hypothetical protein L1987_21239 [Smallanthus sonchifolius]
MPQISPGIFVVLLGFLQPQKAITEIQTTQGTTAAYLTPTVVPNGYDVDDKPVSSRHITNGKSPAQRISVSLLRLSVI